MNSKNLHSLINHKKKELTHLAIQKKSLQDQEVYRKSCELDLLVVACMREQLKEMEKLKRKIRKIAL